VEQLSNIFLSSAKMLFTTVKVFAVSFLLGTASSIKVPRNPPQLEANSNVLQARSDFGIEHSFVARCHKDRSRKENTKGFTPKAFRGPSLNVNTTNFLPMTRSFPKQNDPNVSGLRKRFFRISATHVLDKVCLFLSSMSNFSRDNRWSLRKLSLILK
jgi:hypothetical protein